MDVSFRTRVFLLKWDGFRAIAEKDKLGVQLYSRNQNDFKKRFPDTLRYVDHITTEGLAMYAGALALGLEGIVAKDAKSPYIKDHE